MRPASACVEGITPGRSHRCVAPLTAPPPGSAGRGSGRPRRRARRPERPRAAAGLPWSSGRSTFVSGTAWLVGAMSSVDVAHRRDRVQDHATAGARTCPARASVSSSRARWARWATSSRVMSDMSLRGRARWSGRAPRGVSAGGRLPGRRAELRCVSRTRNTQSRTAPTRASTRFAGGRRVIVHSPPRGSAWEDAPGPRRVPGRTRGPRRCRETRGSLGGSRRAVTYLLRVALRRGRPVPSGPWPRRSVPRARTSSPSTSSSAAPGRPWTTSSWTCPARGPPTCSSPPRSPCTAWWSSRCGRSRGPWTPPASWSWSRPSPPVPRWA